MLNLAPSLVGLTDSTSLLWRLRLKGLEDLCWTIAQRFANDRFPNGGNVFAEFHLAMLAAGLKNIHELQACQTRLQKLVATGNQAATIAAHWVAALENILIGEAKEAQDAIDLCIPEAARLGGSHAQRSVLDLTQTWLNQRRGS